MADGKLDLSRICVSWKGLLNLGVPAFVTTKLIEIKLLFPGLYGAQLNGSKIIYLAKLCYHDNHLARTLNHEVLHAVVHSIEGAITSFRMDMPVKDDYSILDILAAEGYLGED